MDFSVSQVSCEVCGEPADVAQNEHVDSLGQAIRWPKAATKPDGIYFAIKCPECGERYQLMARRPNDPCNYPKAQLLEDGNSQAIRASGNSSLSE